MLKLAIATSIVALSLAATPAYAEGAALVSAEAASALAPNRYVWSDPGSSEPVSVVISIPDQRAYVYRGQVLVAASSVSTGKDGKETPAGVYPILQKAEDHKSNLYNSAPMPFMQRLTWDGVALHAGRNPGFPASHGCVRMPAEFAKKLFAITRVGTMVTVLDSSVVAPESPADDLLPEFTDNSEVAKANKQQLASLDD